MARPVTLFSGQWADLPFETVCAKAKQFGYDGVELPCWGDHFEVDKALKDKLLLELPGILNWCIEGCLRWQRGSRQGGYSSASGLKTSFWQKGRTDPAGPATACPRACVPSPVRGR